MYNEELKPESFEVLEAEDDILVSAATIVPGSEEEDSANDTDDESDSQDPELKLESIFEFTKDPVNVLDEIKGTNRKNAPRVCAACGNLGHYKAKCRKPDICYILARLGMIAGATCYLLFFNDILLTLSLQQTM